MTARSGARRCGPTWPRSCASCRRADVSDRGNQRLRTRKDLIAAAAHLMREGRKPSLEEVAEAALVSRATAYRYFPNVEALLAEASVDVVVPNGEALFAGDPSADPEDR